ncbi:hypothetical protein [Streptomyces sp. NPDC055140]
MNFPPAYCRLRRPGRARLEQYHPPAVPSRLYLQVMLAVLEVEAAVRSHHGDVPAAGPSTPWHASLHPRAAAGHEGVLGLREADNVAQAEARFAAWQHQSKGSGESAEGVVAFLDDRPPQFTWPQP